MYVVLTAVLVLVFLPIIEKKSWWDGIHVELEAPELELSG